ncbi:Proline--tRNA ligase [subsurface metagenome]|nr:proline--tRNA ligase [Dehalococcoidia bacterium]
MRLSQLFGKTQREIPSEADTASHQLLLRAGMIMQVAAGVYSYMPLGWRVLKKIENIIREEMDNAGGQELAMPVLQPVELWQQTGRDQSFGKGLFTLLDRRERTLVLGPTHEEVLTQMVSHHVQSYRDLPQLLYQIQTKFRDEPRPRGGLIRVREFIMKDLYSFDVDEDGLEVSYQKMVQAYRNIYGRCALPALFVEADSGAIGGKDSHEFMLIAENGEDEVIRCDSCQYATNVDKAVSVKRQIKPEKLLPLEEVATPGMKTIEELANFLNMPKDHTLKAVFYAADGQVVFAMIRGDLDVNEVKLQRLLKCTDLHLATEAEVSAAGISAGYASPMGLKGIKIVADDSVTGGINFVAGGNKPDIHIKNVNYPRDFKADIVADIARVGEGDACPKCGGMLKSMPGIEIGHVFKLGTFLSNALGANFIDEKGDSRPIIMGCYGIGLGRLLAAAVEHYHDDKGIIWPLSIAPYQVYLCPLYREDTNVTEVAERLYRELQSTGLEVLFDDREESPGVKFNDADLLGIPLRGRVRPRKLQNHNVETKWRAEKESQLVLLDEAVAKIKELVKAK